MTRGRRGGCGGWDRGECEGGGGGRGEVDDDEGGGSGGGIREREEGETRSIMCAILSSSSGQMSGQCEKPK